MDGLPFESWTVTFDIFYSKIDTLPKTIEDFDKPSVFEKHLI